MDFPVELILEIGLFIREMLWFLVCKRHSEQIPGWIKYESELKLKKFHPEVSAIIKNDNPTPKDILMMLKKKLVKFDGSRLTMTCKIASQSFIHIGNLITYPKEDLR
jgi:hypothetical protein